MTRMNAGSPEYARDIQAVAARLLAHEGPVVVLSHENPDGDALGSVLGLTRALRALGREVVAPMDVPRYLRFLPQPGETAAPLAAWPAGALAAVLDVDNNDPARVAGADLGTFTGDVLNLDHHGTNLRRATAGVVDPSKPATTMLVADVIDALDIPWSEEIATPLMLGLKTDTGSFSFDSVSAETFEYAARLRAHGARLGWLGDQMAQNSHSYYLLLREVLGTMEFTHGGRVVMARVDDAMLARAGATWEDVESYVGLLRSAEGTVLAVMVKDFGDRVKLSLRSRGPVSAQNIAVALGGGGHVPAAGASRSEPYAQVRRDLDAAITAELARVDAQAN
ncbi:DHH family phosphoesterase [Deinococcus gobiensis]|uniref:Phosphoesterase, RecJ-like protein n=1 Tax=Deinococcus gobiensis (strain DSM 21396 / JCM 16679 / CGMCC 1.7299 / I-0) TaxID=745776 RepID=H8GSC7_DEIGI|nr:bifunctional oligoribonuclease/PAP phosphatase NrnA [Deinococcus gobiensis]AFD25200.1 Phosphoesterase, RecJ-like protein [Deinococcus gobiensis I-0]